MANDLFVTKHQIRDLQKASKAYASRIGETDTFFGYLGRYDGTNTVIDTRFPLSTRMVFYYEMHGGSMAAYSSAPLATTNNIPFKNCDENMDLPVVLGKPAGTETVYVLRQARYQDLSGANGRTPIERLLDTLAGAGIMARRSLAVLPQDRGTATLVSGTKVVSTAAVAADSLIFLTAQETGTLTGVLRVSARVAGTSFTILSSTNTDTAVVAWQILEP